MSNPTVQAEHAKQNIKLAVDNCIFTVKDGKLFILLIKMKSKLQGMWALPGGLIKDTETIGAAAQRILKQETGLSDNYLEQLYTFSQPNRDPFARVISTAYFALIPDANIELKPSPKYDDVRWYPVKKLPELAYDHNHIVKYAKQRLEWKISYTNAAWSLLPEKFTLTELQKVYEAILNKKLDKRNFRKKIDKVGLLKETKQTKLEGAHRPAKLYEFSSKKKKIVEII
ncbi:MAG: NUDIX hydrolase [Chloroflexi bacterium]|jgi:8-oxo-dGTP diphosphatase|nr:NUDIX hydrolase [Candidatus Parcubacteria bacterium]MBT7082143.1 NUDIX hydrolase [Chloroflexota bacterium]